MSRRSRIHPIGFWPLLLVAMLVNILSQTIHETGHHLVYQVMGRDPVWGFTKLVQLWDRPPLDPDRWVEIATADDERGWLRLGSLAESRIEKTIAAAAGPLAGLLGAILGLAIARWGKNPALNQIGLALALSASLAAVLYYVRSLCAQGGMRPTSPRSWAFRDSSSRSRWRWHLPLAWSWDCANCRRGVPG